ncbi:hypothetical protein AVEN_152799-1 [Araneus ventricosus]|uniref:Uncharacterized protein n=1 Tax=Araneus ventricosus TaxID=182803 RepID=A0A4Y2G2L4_ARAVE|nr:hypothetical protein AVEN_152799-1 [Araneus ventricosus]
MKHRGKRVISNIVLWRKHIERAPQFQLHKILWVAVSSTVGLRVERQHHLQSVCGQDVFTVDQTDKKVWLVGATASTLQPRLSSKRFSADDDDDDAQHEVLLWMRQQPK